MAKPPVPNSGQYPVLERLESRTQGMPRRDIFQSARSNSPGFISFYVVESVRGIRLLDPDPRWVDSSVTCTRLMHARYCLPHVLYGSRAPFRRSVLSNSPTWPFDDSQKNGGSVLGQVF
jgi:hypothetical protein